MTLQNSSNTAFWFTMIQDGFLQWYRPKKLKYGKSRLGEFTLT